MGYLCLLLRSRRNLQVSTFFRVYRYASRYLPHHDFTAIRVGGALSGLIEKSKTDKKTAHLVAFGRVSASE